MPEDCYQETFLAAVEVWGREPVRSSRALLQRLATTRAMDRLRVRYRRAGREEASPLDFDGTAINTPLPGEAAETEELTQLLRKRWQSFLRSRLKFFVFTAWKT